MRPIIGLTTFTESKGTSRYNCLNCNYVNAIVEAGGTPVMIPLVENKDTLLQYMNIIDGILFTGGEDVLPLYYGENPIKDIGAIEQERDDYEIFLFKEAYDANLPIMGICRGIQLINVALGGSLYQDINSQITGSLGHSPKGSPMNQVHHMIRIEKNSKLYDIFENETIAVNSFHHQSIKDLGKDLKVTAYSYDGIIEAVESIEKDFVLGVQWHPEALVPKHELFKKLFEEFVKRCSK
ncbi:gamma-glutamyl-gamma-aminobutyrate hydrolase family protein [Lutispora thermophila]|mgnify:CR=1 FL=1|uniref:Putative glutamine amidotransferase n=1 Tax=Lutispora thermophila DSM 19022 TaxID=1122184 RepID=A0A1M6BZ82_9FIRM|nr:gamma-glutamyl-gamma-aminobutyrate hydrolase family protein [Lutispora thermophila]SHI54115.1 putative glutamine amidotransferase [Lutispora thermophila DSM 19022]